MNDHVVVVKLTFLNHLATNHDHTDTCKKCCALTALKVIQQMAARLDKAEVAGTN